MQDHDTSHKDVDLKSFHMLLTRLEGGALNEELTREIHKAVQEISDACLDRGGKHKASVTLKLDFVMTQKDKIVEVEADIQTKLPKTPRGRAGMFFCNEHGHLLRENPRQLSLDDELAKKRLEDAERAAGH